MEKVKYLQWEKIPLHHHRSNLGISQQAEQSDWIPLTTEFCSQWQRIRIHTHTQNFCSLLSVWLPLSHDAKPIEKKVPHLLGALKPQGLFLQLLLTEPHWISVMREKSLKKPNSEFSTILLPEVILYFKVCMQSYFLLLHKLGAGWTAAASLPCPHPLSFRDRMYLNYIITFSHRITKPLQTYLAGAVAYTGGCFRGK